MKAAVLYSGKNRLEIEDMPRPSLRPGAVRVRVHSCGVCGSDVHAVIDRKLKPSAYPRILGHEASGVVLECGEGVKVRKPGDRVVLFSGTSCGHCRHCDAGHENACEQTGVLGFNEDGAFAEEIVVQENFLFTLPAAVPFDQGAILADAVSTPYHAVRYAGRFQPGETAAVFGCGGLGVHGVLLLKALGAAKIAALDVDDGALENARRAGADICINVKGLKSPGKVLKEKTGGVDIALDFSGFYGNIPEAVRAMNTLGRIVLVGIGGGSLKLQMPGVITFKQLSICGSYGSDRRGVPELIELHLQGKLDLSKSITSHHNLSEINDCLYNLHERKGNPIRFIINP